MNQTLSNQRHQIQGQMHVDITRMLYDEDKVVEAYSGAEGSSGRVPTRAFINMAISKTRHKTQAK